MFRFDASRDSGEIHPEGSKVVICTEGEMTLVQAIGGEKVRTTIHAGEYAINAPGVWHTADVEERATAIFITAGEGTQARPR
jgi:quercetin dioxygenase-like cupin family protein